MGLTVFNVEGFRALDCVAIKPNPKINLIFGQNASGKTSLLESIYYLGRGRSFRSLGNQPLIHHGKEAFTLFGALERNGPNTSIGIETTKLGRKIHINGKAARGMDLIKNLPVLVIDPEIHQLLQGSPIERRRLIDWGVFHVKHEYLKELRSYNKALKQRNAALKNNDPDNQVSIWNQKLIMHGEALNCDRIEYLSEIIPLFESICSKNLSIDVKISYLRGWPKGKDLGESLILSTNNDKSRGFTQFGPHRADLVINFGNKRARQTISRGQQKLLAAALVITQAKYYSTRNPSDLVLLVDDPAAELDKINRENLFSLLENLSAQLFITALEEKDLKGFKGGNSYAISSGKIASLV
ncbi:MAG: DNA replication/repair protein RecF [Pseudomonadota bacterium]|nr:DNA replication/repair protein RecF [Pseudomonadota bacterium]